MLSSRDNPRDINEIWQDIAEYRLYQLYLPDCRATEKATTAWGIWNSRAEYIADSSIAL